MADSNNNEININLLSILEESLKKIVNKKKSDEIINRFFKENMLEFHPIIELEEIDIPYFLNQLESLLNFYINQKKINILKDDVQNKIIEGIFVKKKIMIVDDEPDIVEMMKIMLESVGFSTIECFSGKECLEKINYEKPDLILLDIMMEPMDGWETLENIKKKEEFKDIPICVVSVLDYVTSALEKNDRQIKEELLKEIENNVVKPFSKDDLLNVIQTIFIKKNT